MNTRIRALYILSKIALDLLMTAAGFVLAYQLRLVIPFPNPTVSVVSFLSYVPMMVVQLVSVIAVFYFNKLYHVVRASSRARRCASSVERG